jgi:predicted transcriptional regulator
METVNRHEFLIALAGAKMSISSFAWRIGVSHQAVHRVLNGKTKSEKISKSMQSLIRREFGKLSTMKKI